jgi:hypothetical protein
MFFLSTGVDMKFEVRRIFLYDFEDVKLFYAHPV